MMRESFEHVHTNMIYYRHILGREVRVSTNVWLAEADQSI